MSHHHEVGRGYEELEMIANARQEYEQAVPSDPNYIICQLHLGDFGFSKNWIRRRANRGLGLLRHYPKNGRLICDTALCLHQSGRTEEAYDLILDNWRNVEWTKEGFYNLACYASTAGDWDRAAFALTKAIKGRTEVAARTFLNSDIGPLLYQGASGNMTTALATAFAHPAFGRSYEEARQTRPEIPIDDILMHRVPSKFRKYLKRNFTSNLFALYATAPVSLRADYLKWQVAELQENLTTALTAIRRSRAFIRGHQLEWAICHAERGNLLGARYHTMFALAKQPEDLPKFERGLRRLGLG